MVDIFRAGPGWLIITIVVALFTLEITALAVASYVVSQNSRATDLLRLIERVDGAMRAIDAAQPARPRGDGAPARPDRPGVTLDATPRQGTRWRARATSSPKPEDILLSSVAARGAVELRIAEDQSPRNGGGPMAAFTTPDPGPVEEGLSAALLRLCHERAILVSIQLPGGRWLNLASPRSPPPPLLAPGSLFWYVIFSGLVVAASIFAVRRLTAPYRQLEMAVTQIGHDLRVAPIVENGSNPARGLIPPSTPCSSG